MVLILVEGVSFKDAMAAPEIRALARAGGAALMTNRVPEDADDPLWYRYSTIGAGGLVGGRGVPGLLRMALKRGGVDMCMESAGEGRRPSRGYRYVGLLAGPTDLCEDVIEPDSDRRWVRVVDGAEDLDLAAMAARAVHLRPGGETLVMVVSAGPSAQMQARGEELTPLVMAKRALGRPIPPRGPLHALTSDGTRQRGLVSNVDVAPTILSFLRLDIPAEMEGRPIRAIDEPAPFDLYRRYLEHRRIRFPVQIAALVYICLSFSLAVFALVWITLRKSIGEGVARLIRLTSLGAVSLYLSLLVGGTLPRLTYGFVIPFLVVSTVLLTLLAERTRSRGPLAPLVFLGALCFGFVVVDEALGGEAFRVPLLGGTMFEGARFYGLPNAFIALLLGGALLLAYRLEPAAGAALLVGAGLSAGFPDLGANVGASTTLFVAAGVWLALRLRGRPDVRGLGIAAAVTAAGLAVVLLANRFLADTATHAGTFVEESGGVGGAWSTFTDRLGLAREQLFENPAAWLPMIGLAVVLLLVLRPRGAVDWGLRRDPRWRLAMVALTVASIAAFFANDTGVAAAAPGFLFALAGVTYPVLVPGAPDPVPMVEGE